MKTILLVFNSARPDSYSYFSKDDKNEYFIIYRNRPDKEIRLPSFIKKELFWSDYWTASFLIRAIKPDTIVFVEIYDIKQIALNIVAKRKGIKTIFLDHGMYNNVSSALFRDKEASARIRKEKLRKLSNIPIILQNYFFYFHSIYSVSFRNVFEFLAFPFSAFIISSYRALHLLPFSEKKPKRFLLFCKNNFEYIKYSYHCEQNEVVYTGMPEFDKFFSDHDVNDKYIFIDHPYLEEKMLGWNHEHHEKVAFSIYDLCRSRNIKFFVKLHPSSDKTLWENYGFDSKYIEILQSGDFVDIYRAAKLVIGFSSTLMVGFISARKNVVLIGWHPEPRIVANDLSSYGVCHQSLNINELKSKFDYWIKNNLALINKEKYNIFIDRFNCPFDGKAAERVLKGVIE